jgi:lipopolysaccharide/colanic/teichoic acid biosynthesis glycosyltransferase
MGLKYLWLTLESGRALPGGLSRELLCLIRPEEEARLRTALAEQAWDYDVVTSGMVEDAEALAEMRKALGYARTLVVSPRPAESNAIAELACEAHLQGIRVVDLETALLEIDPSVSTRPEQLVRHLAQGSVHQDWKVRTYAALKNTLEPVLAFTLIVLFAPILGLTWLAIRLTSPGPAFYRQTRAGLNGKPFELIKFRSMRIDAEKDGPVWASARSGDQRLTPIGGFLRASHLDELPQLWNVVRGELSFVGPRPERPVFIEKLVGGDVPLFKLRVLVKPGMTGWAQIRQGYANSVDDSRRKLEYDLYYVMKHSLWMDLVIVFGTLHVIATGGTEGRKRARLAQSPGGMRRRPAGADRGSVQRGEPAPAAATATSGEVS